MDWWPAHWAWLQQTPTTLVRHKEGYENGWDMRDAPLFSALGAFFDIYIAHLEYMSWLFLHSVQLLLFFFRKKSEWMHSHVTHFYEDVCGPGVRWRRQVAAVGRYWEMDEHITGPVPLLTSLPENPLTHFPPLCFFYRGWLFSPFSVLFYKGVYASSEVLFWPLTFTINSFCLKQIWH